MDTLTFDEFPFLKELGLQKDMKACYYGGEWKASGAFHFAVNPNSGKQLARVQWASKADYDQAISVMLKARHEWMNTPAPARGEVVRKLGEAFRKHKVALGKLISLQMGKILSEGLGEVQEAIDICDYACGLSRSIGGSVIPSERPDHFLMENYTPYGLMGVITAFNFPCAVMMWNYAIGLVTGNLMVWKGAIFSNLVSIATARIVVQVFRECKVPEGVFVLLQGDRDIGELIVQDQRIPLISFTGSTQVGRIIAQKVAARFGKAILQLGGNNATIIMDDADLDLAMKGSVFAAAGTCGQRCTTLRRLIVHQKVYDQVVSRLVKAYKTISIGDSLDQSNNLTRNPMRAFKQPVLVKNF